MKPTSPTDSLKITREKTAATPKATPSRPKEKRTSLGSGLTQVTYF